MNELDEAWSQMLAGAIQNANASGRGDVADYLALKQSNDLIRKTSVEWLFGAFVEIAAEATRQYPAITIEREEPHEFAFQNARMAGSILRIGLGVRRMTVEAGWTRLPAHGFMRNRALAAGRIVHFGIPEAGADLVLVREGEIPVWNCLDGRPFDSHMVAEQFAVFLDK